MERYFKTREKPATSIKSDESIDRDDYVGRINKRKFRPEWLGQFDWLQSKDGAAYCIACDKPLQNHFAHLSRHAGNQVHNSNVERKNRQLTMYRFANEDCEKLRKPVHDSQSECCPDSNIAEGIKYRNRIHLPVAHRKFICDDYVGKIKKRKFRPEWLGQFDWLQSKEGFAYCIVCDKPLQNHFAHLSRHAANQLHNSNAERKNNQLTMDRFENEDSEKLQKPVHDLLSECCPDSNITKTTVLAKELSKKVKNTVSDLGTRKFSLVVDETTDLACKKALVPKKIIIVYNLCRICLTEDSSTSEMQPLFETEDGGTSNEIVQRIEICGGIFLKRHKEIPNVICARCLEKLEVSYKFRSMCQASEHALLDAIVKSEMKAQPKDYEDAEIISKHEDEKEDEMHCDMHTEFIALEDITETFGEEVLESDMEPYTESVEEFIEYTDRMNEYFEEELPKSIIKKTVIQRQPVINENSGGKRGRPKTKEERTSIKSELQSGNETNRGRKKKKEPEIASIMCEICGNTYTKLNLLKMHMRRHMGKKPFECEICGKTFTCHSEIGRHMRVHTGEKPYTCKYCGRSFADWSTNAQHERLHRNERPFTCQTCGKSFTYSTVLKNHMLTHTGEKPFPCIPCNKTFSRKDLLDQHNATITHQQTVRNLATTDLKV